MRIMTRSDEIKTEETNKTTEAAESKERPGKELSKQRQEAIQQAENLLAKLKSVIFSDATLSKEMKLLSQLQATQSTFIQLSSDTSLYTHSFLSGRDAAKAARTAKAWTTINWKEKFETEFKFVPSQIAKVIAEKNGTEGYSSVIEVYQRLTKMKELLDREKQSEIPSPGPGLLDDMNQIRFIPIFRNSLTDRELEQEEKNQRFLSTLCDNSLLLGNLKLLQWLSAKQTVKFNSSHVLCASQSGNLDLVRFVLSCYDDALHDDEGAFPPAKVMVDSLSFICGLCESKSINVLEYFIKIQMITLTPESIQELSQSENPAVLEWLSKKFPTAEMGTSASCA